MKRTSRAAGIRGPRSSMFHGEEWLRRAILRCVYEGARRVILRCVYEGLHYI